jgi:hypothetical protein
MKTVTLHDGRQVDHASEDWRHECEARTLLRMPLPSRKKHLLAVEAKRGIPERQRLQNTLMVLWIERQAHQLADLNEAARMERLQALRGENRPHIIDRIEARMRDVMDRRSGIAANDNKQPELFGT